MNNWKLRHSFTGNATSDVQTVNGYLADPAYHLTTNLLLQSNQFDTTWTLDASMTLTSGQSGYDGSSDAWLVEKTAIQFRALRQTPVHSNVVTFSVYAKQGTLRYLNYYSPVANAPQIWFDLQAGVVGTKLGTYIEVKMESVGGGWYRCSVTYDAASGGEVRIYPQDLDGSYGSVAGNIYIQDAQLEEGTQATTYVETTTEPVTLPDTFNVTVVPDGKEYAAPLFIPRTNLLLQSNQFDTTWSSVGTTLTSGQSGYDGTNSAWLVDKSSQFSGVSQTTSTTGTNTLSVYAKSGTLTEIVFRLTIDATVYSVRFDLSGGTVLSDAGLTCVITDIGSGWYRCSASFSGNMSEVSLRPDVAQVTGSIYIQDAQLEEGSVATEYIPTTTAAVTRDWSAFGRVQNQVPGISNGTHTHTGAASGSGIAATTITGSGSGATFAYDFDTLGVLTTLTADGAGSGYKVGDKLSIDTTEGHTIEFRLVEGSNAATVSVSMGAAKPNKPVPFPVSKMRVEGLTDRTVLFMDERSRYVFPKPTPYLLDTYEGAAAAYSLRRLRSSYTGPAVRVRRTSNNDELDIYFNRDGSLDTATLEAFCAGTDGFVKVWYDQGQGGNDATQTTTADQPQIVSSGSVVTENGLPALDFDGVNSYMEAADVTTTQPTTVSFVATGDTANDYFFDGDDATDRQAAFSSSGIYSAFAGVTQGTGVAFVAGLQINMFALFNDTTGVLYLNNTGGEPKNMGIRDLSGLCIGQRYTATGRLDGRFQELIFWNADHSGDRTTIQTNVNDFYGIY